MNSNNLHDKAVILRKLLEHYSLTDVDVERLHQSLVDLIAAAEAKKIKDPIEKDNIPGRFYFDEKGLSKYVDLENAYVDFKVEISGGYSNDAAKALALIRKFKGKK
ncbi:hypothetical protein [Gallaecimonas pentaromativorans]|uniref:hypothetical protein n=1 Tax=Gallaecimonas pentaromativorans TaxID=584787 RepID=UPI00067EA659|nr:hypothetical protein [Gallaecimonas pentaromativorans]